MTPKITQISYSGGLLWAPTTLLLCMKNPSNLRPLKYTGSFISVKSPPFTLSTKSCFYPQCTL